MTLIDLYKQCLQSAKMRFLLGEIITLSAALIYLRPSVLAAIFTILGGAVMWMVFEYFLHRYFLHMPRISPKWPRLRRAHDQTHFVHHQHPNDPDQLFMSEKGSFALLLLSAILGGLLDGASGALGISLGFGIMLFQYGVTHLADHSDYRPTTRYGRYMKQGHLDHHFVSVKGWFGVTTPLIDYLMGTWRAPSSRRPLPAQEELHLPPSCSLRQLGTKT